MLQFPYIQEECPICGRPIKVRNEHVGKWVSCEHCQGEFVAERPPDDGSGGYSDIYTKGRFSSNRTQRLLRHADELLQLCGSRYAVSCCPECPASVE